MNPENPILKNIRYIVMAFILIAIIFIILGALNEHPTRMWQIYLVNFLLWTGIAQGGVIFSAALELTNARWGDKMRQVAESLVYFLPVSLILLLVMLLGTDHIFPWISKVEISESKQIYLNVPFLFGRSFFGLGLLTILSLVFVKKRRLADEGKIERPRKWAVGLVISYAFIYTFISYDFVMSLSPHWYSTIMGMHFFTACFYTAVAVVLVSAVFGKWHLFPIDFMKDKDFHDIGKLVFGFSIFWMSLLWSQFLVIWYGNLPEETEFLHLRLMEQPWETFTWTVIILGFIVPLIILLNKRVKTNQYISGVVGLLIFIGSYFHMYILVVPSLSPHYFYFGFTEIFISLGFLGLFILMQELRLRKLPIK
jgi:hypothetical protein